MARQPYFVDSNTKQMDIQQNFSGGMVTQPHPEKIRDHEYVLLENVDIVEGGSIRTRSGYASFHYPLPSIQGKTQGYFRYYKGDGTHINIVAISGKLYKVEDDFTYKEIIINGLSSFQTERNIEAVQYRNKMYFATGSGLVEFDGTTASLTQPYAPNGLEALYIGTNALAKNPSAYLTDTTGASNSILGVVPDKRYGLLNDWVTFTAYVSYVPSDVLEYQFEVKLRNEPTYNVMQAWSTSKVFTTSFDKQADYMIRVSLRKQGTTTVLSQYVLPRYRVNATPDTNPEPSINFDNIKTCNRIFVHYDRLFLYGDTTNPDFLYISHLEKFNYFPRTNIIKVTDNLRGTLKKVQQYKNFLVCFTDNSIYMITGTNPREFAKQPIHTTIGTLKPDTVRVMKNYIVFVGNDNGVYILKSFNYASDDKMNVERIDDQIRDHLTEKLKNATTTYSHIYDNQYFLHISDGKSHYVYRYHYELYVWVRDKVAFSFSTFHVYNSEFYATSSQGGIVYKLTKGVYKDEVNTPYEANIVTKSIDFGMPYHRKKIKQIYILAQIHANLDMNVEVYTDDINVFTGTLTYDSLQTTDTQRLKAIVSGRFKSMKVSINFTVDGEVTLLGLGYVFKMNTPK